MKKPFIIFSVFLLLVSVLVYSCGTKDDPAVPDHTTNITNISNSVTFHTFLFTLGFKICDIDTSSGKHWEMRGKDVNQNFAIGVLFADSTAPNSFPLTYSVVNPLTSTGLTNSQCFISLAALTVSQSPWVATGGTISLNKILGKITVSMKNIPVINLSDSSTSTVTGDWTCP